MRSTLLLTVFGVVFLFAGSSVNAWGGIYTNRFSPEMLQNMGYGAPRSYQSEVSTLDNNSSGGSGEIVWPYLVAHYAIKAQVLARWFHRSRLCLLFDKTGLSSQWFALKTNRKNGTNEWNAILPTVSYVNLLEMSPFSLICHRLFHFHLWYMQPHIDDLSVLTTKKFRLKALQSSKAPLLFFGCYYSQRTIIFYFPPFARRPHRRMTPSSKKMNWPLTMSHAMAKRVQPTSTVVRAACAFM